MSRSLGSAFQQRTLMMPPWPDSGRWSKRAKPRYLDVVCPHGPELAPCKHGLTRL